MKDQSTGLGRMKNTQKSQKRKLNGEKAKKKKKQTKSQVAQYKACTQYINTFYINGVSVAQVVG